MIQQQWEQLPDRFPNIVLHESVIMPNHFHAIVEITNCNGLNGEKGQPQVIGQQGIGQPQGIAPTRLGNVVAAFKSITTVLYIRGVKESGWEPFNKRLWQRNYYEHIIRSPQSHDNIAEYIINNPSKWESDTFYIS